MILVDTFIIGFVLILTGIILFLVALYVQKKKRLITDTPTSKIRSLAMGLVEIFGQVIPFHKRVFKSPFTNKDCVYYKYTIEELRSNGKNSHWVTIKKDEHKTLFYLKDETGMVLVDPTSAQIEAKKDFEFQSGFRKDPPEQVIQFLSAHKLSYEGFLGLNKTLRYRETIIVPDDTLYIMGTAGENPYKKEGQINQVDSIMIQKGTVEKQYYISDKSEKQIVRQLTLATYITGGCGIILMIVGIILSFRLI
jgi:uncharacterized protein YjeT (DUF2065 family)